jgi:hypothetical protein
MTEQPATEEQKRCAHCKETKPSTEFSPIRRSGRVERHSYCKACRNAQARARAAEVAAGRLPRPPAMSDDARRERRRAYYQRNKEVRQAYGRAYYQRNREVCIARSKAWHQRKIKAKAANRAAA